MSTDLNTLLTALYVLIDDRVVPVRTGRGHRPVLTDSELICLAVAQILLGHPNERHWVRHVHANPDLLAMFPDMLGQSGYRRRLKTAQPLLCKAVITLAICCPSWFDDLWITDATPVPWGHEEPLLAIPDAIAWCWQRGGTWKVRVRAMVGPIRRV